MGASWGDGVDSAVAIALVATLLAPVAVLAALPKAPPPHPQIGPSPVEVRAELTALPVFGSAAGRARARAALIDEADPALLDTTLRGAVERALPAPARKALLAHAKGSSPAAPRAVKGPEGPLLDLVGLLIAAQAAGRLPNGAASAVLLLAGRDSCAARLNAAFVALASGYVGDAELAPVRRACPDDPLPLLLQAEQDGSGDIVPLQDPARAVLLEADRTLTEARAAGETAPFTARRLASEALRSYETVQGTTDAVLGAVEALLLLDRADDALARLRLLPPTAQVADRTAHVLEVLQRPGEAAHVLARAPAPDPVDLLPASFADASLLRGSTGASSASAVTLVQLGAPPGTGVMTVDVSFVPQWRPVPGVTGPLTGCRAVQRARDEAAAGRPEVAARLLTQTACGERPARLARILAALGHGDPAQTALAAQAEAQALDEVLGPVEDDLQELQRWAGDSEAALRTVRGWREAAPQDPLPQLREAELAFLKGDLHGAAALADGAVALSEGEDRGLALLLAGAARAAAPDRQGEAPAVLAEAEQVLRAVGPESELFDTRAGYLLLQARLQRGTVLLAQGRFVQAQAAFDGAAATYGGLYVVAGARPQLADLGLALAALGAGRPQDGLAAARAAVQVDPDDPLALLDLAFVERRTGDLVAAERSLRRARTADPAFGLAALDLGTLLAEQGRDDEAGDLLRRALEREPRSASGWHTLGVVLSRGDVRDQLQSQAAFARAAREDRAFRGRERTPVYDDAIYVSRLDLSKPLPPEWSFTSQERRLPASALVVAALLGLVAHAWGRLVGRAVDVVQTRADAVLKSLRRVPTITGPWLSVLASLGVLLLPVLRADLPLVETSAAAAGTGLLLLALVRVRRRVGPPTVRHVSWTPGLVVGVVGAATGVAGFAPVPAADGTDGRAVVHRSGPLLLLGTGLLLLTVAAVTEVPLARVLATSGLAMAAVCLTPIAPYDGPYVQAPKALWAAAVVGAAVAVGLAVGVL